MRIFSKLSQNPGCKHTNQNAYFFKVLKMRNFFYTRSYFKIIPEAKKALQTKKSSM